MESDILVYDIIANQYKLSKGYATLTVIKEVSFSFG